MCRCRQLIYLMATIFFTLCSSAPLAMAEELNNTQPFTRTIVNYDIPNIAVVRQDGQKLSFTEALDNGRPVIMNFIFASCSAICPMLSHTFSKIQDDVPNAHLMSISIDPENDTPAILAEYAKKFKAKANWDHYTGTLEASVAIQKAFDTYRGDKMNHASTVLMRPAPDKPWLRLEGFVTPNTIIDEYNEMVGINLNRLK